MNTRQTDELYETKYNKTVKLFNNLDVNDLFKKNFIDTISINEFFIK